MKSGVYCCNSGCQLVKYAARYRSALAQVDILDSAVYPSYREQFQKIQPMAAMVGRGANQLDMCPLAHRERVSKKMPLKSANRSYYSTVTEGETKKHKIRLASKMPPRRAP